MEDEVIDYLINHSEIESYFQQFVEKDIVRPKTRPDFERLIVSPPSIISVTEPKVYYQNKAIKTNYLEKEQLNKALGLYGEELVIEYEKWYLIKSGKEHFADKIKWISKEEGDGAGFDILSRNLNGTDKFIEVKTTRLGKETPFFFSSNELQVSISKANDYHLYRVFNANSDVRLFAKNGSLSNICKSIPTMYKGYF